MNLKLIEPTKEYAKQVMNFKQAFIENNKVLHGCARLENCETYEEWTDFENRLKAHYGEGYVPSSVFLAIKEEEGNLVGIIDIRHYLNDHLFTFGGNIGYCVLPSERQKGYAKEMLRLAIDEVKKLKLEKVLVTCNKDNIASKKCIITNGGVLENEVLDKDGNIFQRYWINTSSLSHFSIHDNLS